MVKWLRSWSKNPGGIPMKLYFAPLACSMATRAAFYEAGVSATFVEVDTRTKRTAAGDDYLRVHPVGMVPALLADDGTLLFENAAILQYVADQFPAANLAPTDAAGRIRLQQWLGFISTELHKALFTPLLDAEAPEGAKAYAIEKGVARLDYLNAYLADREYLLDAFSVADAYMATILGWSVVTPVDLKKWPAVHAYLERMRQRPSIARAFGEEMPMYVAEQQRKRAGESRVAGAAAPS
jgi:glutathione S-transferase